MPVPYFFVLCSASPQILSLHRIFFLIKKKKNTPTVLFWCLAASCYTCDMWSSQTRSIKSQRYFLLLNAVVTDTVPPGPPAVPFRLVIVSSRREMWHHPRRTWTVSLRHPGSPAVKASLLWKALLGRLQVFEEIQPRSHEGRRPEGVLWVQMCKINHFFPQT